MCTRKGIGVGSADPETLCAASSYAAIDCMNTGQR